MYRRSQSSRQREATAAALELMARADSFPPAVAAQTRQSPAIASARAVENALDAMLATTEAAAPTAAATTTFNTTTTAAAMDEAVAETIYATLANDTICV